LETVSHIPEIYDESVVDRLAEVGSDKIIPLLRQVGGSSGLLLSPSAAANLQGAIDLSGTVEEGTIVTVFADDASKYGELYKEILN